MEQRYQKGLAVACILRVTSHNSKRLSYNIPVSCTKHAISTPIKLLCRSLSFVRVRAKESNLLGKTYDTSIEQMMCCEREEVTDEWAEYFYGPAEPKSQIHLSKMMIMFWGLYSDMK